MMKNKIRAVIFGIACLVISLYFTKFDNVQAANTNTETCNAFVVTNTTLSNLWVDLDSYDFSKHINYAKIPNIWCIAGNYNDASLVNVFVTGRITNRHLYEKFICDLQKFVYDYAISNSLYNIENFTEEK